MKDLFILDFGYNESVITDVDYNGSVCEDYSL